MNIRNQILKKNLSYGLVFKAGAILVTYLTIPLLIKGLGVMDYGVWVTIFSIFGWIYYLDLGIGNGVKNNITTALVKKDFLSANQYINTAYISIFLIALLFLVVSGILIWTLNLSSILNAELDESTVKIIFLITLVSFFLNFILSLYKQLFYAIQKSAIVELSLFLTNLIIFLVFIALLKYSNLSLINVALIYGISNVSISLIFNYVFFKRQKELVLSPKYFNRTKTKDIMGIGFEFFIIQVCLVIILTTDNLIISYLLGPAEVTTYSNVLKLFQIFLVFSALILTPLWALYTEAFLNKDFEWIKSVLRRLNYVFVFAIAIVILTVIYAKEILYLWIGEDLYYSDLLIVLTGVFVLIRIYGDIYMYFLNGVGKIKLQMWLFIVGAVINIPLSVVFVSYFNLGSSGVILATCISLFGLSIAMPIQTYSVLKKNSFVREEIKSN
ncbi:MATE family efflux transporter [uncultured Gelidibacter sp.]|uniref:MATE family efflux transporter n=1 Tax=uncultured Gelidibacter sp. TaxID=259318 RepID=UPI002631D570|nr:MATE family efflux transporter [uncultured Gelidibacter sp.]